LTEFAAAAARAIRIQLETVLPEADALQQAAWDQSIPLIQQAAHAVLSTLDDARGFGTVLEYFLPRQGGRRPDVILLDSGTVLVIEYKGKDAILSADIDQVARYVRDLRHYHALSHDLRIVPILVVIGAGKRRLQSGVTIVPPSVLPEVILEEARGQHGPLIDRAAWLDAAYLPQASLLESARRLFRDKSLPRIKRARSERVDAVVDRLVTLAHEARSTSRRRLVLVTGVPGAGKTLVGLKLAYDERLPARAIVLSGNRPLVSVLQHALGPGAPAFVNLIKPFIDEHANGPAPPEQILVFDEAQRAWDRDKMRKHHPGLGDRSEPDWLLRIASRAPWTLVVALVGEGQEIFTGEEAGLEQWNAALGSEWIVHGPDYLRPVFRERDYRSDDDLHLSTSIRQHAHRDISLWIARLLEGRPERGLADDIIREGFSLRLTREFTQACQYLRQQYPRPVDERFGLVASSKGKDAALSLGVQPVNRFSIGEWFNTPPSSPWSCCQLNQFATEFECQGLELDHALVCWGDDFTFDGAQWKDRKVRYQDRVISPFRLRQNSYRVLLSRGRDGIVVFVPPAAKMNATADLLLQAGMQPL
jgi:hypothetical protein